MRYTKYLSKVLKAQGVPHLNVDQYSILMNIVYLEARPAELEDLTRATKEQDKIYQYYLRMHRLQDKISSLTNSKEPQEVLDELVNNSD